MLQRFSEVGSVLHGWLEFAGLENDGPSKKQGVEFAGLENDGQSRKGGSCRTGKWRTIKKQGVEFAGLENDGLENDGLEQENL